MKMQDLKVIDQLARRHNAGHANARPDLLHLKVTDQIACVAENAGPKIARILTRALT